jgi:hypothetical protein
MVMNCSSSCAIAGEAKAALASSAPEKAAVENVWRFMNTPLYIDVMSVFDVIDTVVSNTVIINIMRFGPT